MGKINGVDYGDLIFSKRHELDKKAYEKYYNDNFIIKNTILEVDFDEDDEYLIYPVEEFSADNEPLSFNDWYGTKSHIKYINTLLRKTKLEKINKKADF